MTVAKDPECSSCRTSLTAACETARKVYPRDESWTVTCRKCGLVYQVENVGVGWRVQLKPGGGVETRSLLDIMFGDPKIRELYERAADEAERERQQDREATEPPTTP